MARRYNAAGELLPRNLTDVDDEGQEFIRNAHFYNEQNKIHAQNLGGELKKAVGECLVHEKANEQCDLDNDDNLKQNQKISKDITEQMRRLDEQEREIKDQLRCVKVELDELEAKHAALSASLTKNDQETIKELKRIETDLKGLQGELQADRGRLQQCERESTQVSENCKAIKADCKHVRETIAEACNPVKSGLGGGGGSGGVGGSSGAGDVGGAAGQEEESLAHLKDEVERMSLLRDFLNLTMPEILAKHQRNTTVLGGMKLAVINVERNTDARSDKLALSKYRLSEIKDARIAKNNVPSASSAAPPPTGPVALTSLSNTSSRPQAKPAPIASTQTNTLTSPPNSAPSSADTKTHKIV